MKCKKRVCGILSLLMLVGCAPWGTHPARSASPNPMTSTGMSDGEPITLAPGEHLLKLRIQAAANINPNPQGQALPVEIRLYQLQDDATFENTDFLALYRNDKTILASGLLAPIQSVSAEPAQEQNLQLALADGVSYLGVLIGFADYEAAQTKLIFPLDAQNKAPLTVELKLDGLKLALYAVEGAR